MGDLDDGQVTHNDAAANIEDKSRSPYETTTFLINLTMRRPNIASVIRLLLLLPSCNPVMTFVSDIHAAEFWNRVLTRFRQATMHQDQGGAGRNRSP